MCPVVGVFSTLTMVFQVKLMCSYCKKHDESEVPDPYYGGPQGFEKVIISLSWSITSDH